MLDALLRPLLMTIALQSPTAPAPHPGIFLPSTSPDIERALLPLEPVGVDPSALLQGPIERPTTELLPIAPRHTNGLLPITRTPRSRASLLLD